MENWEELLSKSNEQLARIGTVRSNLLVAKGIPSLGSLDIPHYEHTCDAWADRITSRLPHVEELFRHDPGRWDNSIHLARLGMMCEVLDCELGIAYNEHQRASKGTRYTDPSDLFLNGVIDRRRGTCGNMALLHVALAERLGWPVSLACVGSHYMARFDNSEVIHNIETTDTGRGGFASPKDAELIEREKIPRKAIACGSDLRGLSPRETVGVFFASRARHFQDTGGFLLAHRDYVLAHSLFPNSRKVYANMMAFTIPFGGKLFECSEFGSPRSIATWIRDGMPGWPELARDTFLFKLGIKP